MSTLSWLLIGNRIPRLTTNLITTCLVFGWTSLTSAEVPTARDVVMTTAEQMIAAIKENRQAIDQDPSVIYGLVDDIVLPHFDFNRMSRWTLGRYWRRATPEQQKRFTDEFRTLLVRTYATVLIEYSDQKITYHPLRGVEGSTQVTVKTEVEPQGSTLSVPINYSMYYHNGAWLVVDVAIDGVSLVANYRNSFAAQIRSRGLESLIKLMSARNSDK